MRAQKLPPEYSRQAAKFVENSDKKTQQRLKDGIEKIPAGDIIPYKAREGYYRLRVGGYRILFIWLSDEQIYVALIDSRGQAYKKGV
ncbi:MAG: type II toxin-antitoxin system RelE/ParE family toxin [Oscillospiraceae bacterium]|nr:type II toxin-antitoxin system RelE/ParE family toxin [Oscillospiraceae bacterium]